MGHFIKSSGSHTCLQGDNGTVRGNSLVGREQEVRTRAPPTHQVQGKAEKILQLLLGEEALSLRTKSVALSVGQPGIWGRVGTGGSQAGGQGAGVTSEEQAWEGSAG